MPDNPRERLCHIAPRRLHVADDRSFCIAGVWPKGIDCDRIGLALAEAGGGLMKAIINNITIEGTPDEIWQYMQKVSAKAAIERQQQPVTYWGGIVDAKPAKRTSCSILGPCYCTGACTSTSSTYIQTYTKQQDSTSINCNSSD